MGEGKVDCVRNSSPEFTDRVIDQDQGGLLPIVYTFAVPVNGHRQFCLRRCLPRAALQRRDDMT